MINKKKRTIGEQKSLYGEILCVVRCQEHTLVMQFFRLFIDWNEYPINIFWRKIE
jgi:hypothetical protein